jgi:MFS family permease
MSEAASRLRGAPRLLLGTPNYLRLWLAGGLGNATRWLELLVAGIFTYDLTGSAFLVAAVTVARTLPMLFLGAIAGVVAEALNRKRLLIGGLAVMAVNTSVLWLLASSDVLRVWHIALGGIVAGTVWTSEMAVRRRMVGEVVEPPLVGQAIALDSVTNSLTRLIGPVLGGAAFQWVGIAGAYALSAFLLLVAALIVAGLRFEQVSRRLSLARVPAEIAEGFAIVRRHPILLRVVLVTIVTNLFGFSYSALMAPLGIDRYGVAPVLVGVLAAGEPSGAVLAGLALAAGWLRMDHPRVFIRGSLLFFAALAATALAPWYWLALALLLIGGLGTAAFSSMQTTLVLTEAPATMRSRVMGLITVCIGTGPLGVLAIGALSEAVGPARAMLTMALAGLLALGLVWLTWPGLRAPAAALSTPPRG